MKIIVGYDGSPRSRDALALGGLLASVSGGRLVLACVYQPSQAISARLAPDPAEQRRADQAVETLLQAPVESFDRVVISRRSLRDTSPPSALHRLARRERADLIVLGSTTRTGLGRVSPGSVAERLIHGAPRAVAVAPVDYKDTAARLNTIAVAYDGRGEAEHALESAASLARRAGARLRILRVRDRTPPLVGPEAAQLYAELEPKLQRQCEEEVASAESRVGDALAVSGAVLAGDPGEALVSATSKGVDLLIAGSRGYGAMRSVLVGGVSNALMRNAACPVLIVPRGVTLDFRKAPRESARGRQQRRAKRSVGTLKRANAANA